jgi:hypothetical protein
MKYSRSLASTTNWPKYRAYLPQKLNLKNYKEQIEAAVFSKDHSLWENLRHELLEIQKDHQLNLRIHV